MAAQDAPQPPGLPQFSHALHGWFMLYVRRYFRRHFHALRVLEADGPGPPEAGGEPLLVYTNHPGWWDPLVFLLLAERLFPDRLNYGPIDARALGKYKFLERIGFLGIEPDSRRGAARFLRLAAAALDRPDVIFWITAQGSFADPRVRPPAIRPGVAHAVAAARRGLVVPLAVEYPFWTERLPEAVAAFGPAVRIADRADRGARDWNAALEEALTATQDRLAAAVMRRDPRDFRTLATGGVGVGFAYDLVRRFDAWRHGRRFSAAHGEETT